MAQQAIPSLWRLHTMSRQEILPDEGVYRARCPAAKASHKASDAIQDVLQVCLILYSMCA